MIPILFGASETNFTTHGLGDLTECIECATKITNEGEYEMSFRYPADSDMYPLLEVNRIVQVKANSYDQNYQLFRIYSFEKELDGTVTVNCQHISYDMSAIPVKAFENVSTAGGALNTLKVQAMTSDATKFTLTANGFTAADKPNTEDQKFKVETPASMRAILLDGDESILGSWGGDLVFDNYNVTLYKTAGQDRGVMLEYGVDITDLSLEENISEMVTAIVPYWKGTTESSAASDSDAVSDGSSDSEELVADVTLSWQQGDLYVHNGANAEGTGTPAGNRIRSPSFVTMSSLSSYKSIKPQGGYKVCVFCWSDSAYLGVWKDSVMTKNIADPFIYGAVDLDALRSYQSGIVTKIKLVAALFANGSIAPSAGNNIALSTDPVTPGGEGGYTQNTDIVYGSVQFASTVTGATYSKQNVQFQDLSEFFPNGKPDAAALNAKAIEWMTAEKIGYPDLSLTVSYANLDQDVRMYDEITVRFPKMNIDVKAKVTSYSYNVLTEKCAEIEVSNVNYTSKWKGLEDASRLKRGLIPPKRIGAGSISGGAGGQIASGSVTSSELSVDSVTTSKIAKDAVTGYGLKNGQISPVKFAINSGTVAKLESMGLDNFFADTIVALDIIAKNIAAENGEIIELNVNNLTVRTGFYLAGRFIHFVSGRWRFQGDDGVEYLYNGEILTSGGYVSESLWQP